MVLISDITKRSLPANTASDCYWKNGNTRNFGYERFSV